MLLLEVHVENVGGKKYQRRLSFVRLGDMV